MREIMEFLKNRPQTWSERREQLANQGKIGLHDRGGFPSFRSLIKAEKETIYLEVKKIIDAPLAISEERYPDQPGHVVQYWTAGCENISEFSHIFEHLDGAPWHKCDARCAAHNLPEFVKRNWGI